MNDINSILIHEHFVENTVVWRDPYYLISAPSGERYVVDTRKAPLGKGTFGTVYECETEKDGQKRVVKILEGHGTDTEYQDNRNEKHLQNEVDAIRHDFFAEDPVKGSTKNPETNDKTFIVMESIPGENLWDLIQSGKFQKWSLRQRFQLVYFLARNLYHLHSPKVGKDLGYIHRDVKPNNVLVQYTEENGKVRVTGTALIDRGDCVKRINADPDHQHIFLHARGFPDYRASEMNAYNPWASTKSDVFSLAVLISRNILNDKKDIVSEECREFLSRMNVAVANKAYQRPTSEDVLKFFDDYRFELTTDIDEMLTEFVSMIEDEAVWMKAVERLKKIRSQFTVEQYLKFLRGLDYFEMAKIENKAIIEKLKKDLILELMPRTLDETFNVFRYFAEKNLVEEDTHKAKFKFLAQNLAISRDNLSPSQCRYFYEQLEKYSDIDVPALKKDDIQLTNEQINAEMGCVIKIGDKTIIKTAKNPKTKKSNFYVFNATDEPLGPGSSGAVFKGQQYDPVRKQIGKTVAIKKSQFYTNKEPLAGGLTSKENIEYECLLLGKQFFVEQPVFVYKINDNENSNLAYAVMEYVPGKQLGKTLERTKVVLDGDFNRLGFEQKSKMIMLLAMDLQLMHRSRDNPEIVHRDVKPDNIVRVRGVTGEILDARFVDLGLSQSIISPNKNGEVRLSDDAGTLLYVSPEVVLKKRAGTKSDIRSFVPVILAVLGIEYPFKNIQKDYCEFNIDSLTSASFGQFPALEIPVKAFLKRMMAKLYRERPDTDETLQFFMFLYHYCHAKTGDDKAEILKAMNELAEKPVLTLDNLLEQFIAKTNDINDKDKREKWFYDQAELVIEIPLMSETQKTQFLTGLLNAFEGVGKQEKYVVRTLVNHSVLKATNVLGGLSLEAKLSYLKLVRKPSNFGYNEASWMLFVQNLKRTLIESGTPKQLLQFLRILNNRDMNGIKEIRKELSTVLQARLEDKNPNRGLNKEGTAYRQLKWALSGSAGSVTFFAQKRLKSAINAKENTALSEMVSKLTVVQAR